jgi:hypothetical protein
MPDWLFGRPKTADPGNDAHREDPFAAADAAEQTREVPNPLPDDNGGHTRVSGSEPSGTVNPRSP